MSGEEHGPKATEVIAAEITSAILGRTDRPELRTDLTGAMARFVSGMAQLAERMAPVLQHLDVAMTDMGRRMAEDAERFANGLKP